MKSVGGCELDLTWHYSLVPANVDFVVPEPLIFSVRTQITDCRCGWQRRLTNGKA